MPFKFVLLRADDLLNLEVEAENLLLDSSNIKDPALVFEKPEQPAYLIFSFPPQSITEQAFFESSQSNPPPDEANEPYNTELPEESEPVPPVAARISRESRLVLRIPPGDGVRIPFTTERLLDWDGWELSVSELADVPAAPTPQERQNAPDIQPPERLETAIELPYRLVLSPNSAATWRHARQAKTVRSLTELWHTRLMLKDSEGNVIEVTRKQTAPLRAIWSPDFNPEKFEADDPPQFQKPDADWGVLTPMTPSDRHEIVVLTSAFHGYVKDKDDFRSYEPLPVNAERLMLSPLGGWLASRGEWDPPAPFKPFIIIFQRDNNRWTRYVQDFSRLRPQFGRLAEGLENIGLNLVRGAAEEADNPAVRENSSPTDAQLPNSAQLSALGMGDLSSILWPGLLGETGDLLNLSEWRHIATQGRDHYVRIVYEGHLYPFGHRAALIKVSERKIRDQIGSDGYTTPLAYLVQRMYIVVRQPLRDYTAPEVQSQLDNDGRGLPFKNIRLTTLVTPDISRPEDGSQIPGTTYSFWVRLGTGTQPADDFKFSAVAEDLSGNAVNFNASLVFVPFGEGHRDLVVTAYNASGEARACLVPGQKVTYAPAGGTENTTLDTSHLYFTTHSAPMNKTFGGFLPRLFMATVNLPAVEALLGKPAGTQIALSDKFLSNDPANTTGLFAEIVEEVSSGVAQKARLLSEFAADQAGGFATPNLSISGLTSQMGPMAGDLDKIAQDEFDPGDFFGDVKDAAKLFGTLSLADLLEPLTLGAGAPKVQFNKEDLGAPPPSVKLRLVTTLDWTPKVKDLNFGIVTFHAAKNGTPAVLEIHGRVEKIVELPPPPTPDPAMARMDGSLTNFTIELLHIVEVLFDRFEFHTQTGQKLKVDVGLDSDNPVRFMEDLQFVEELRKTIPAGLFGDGPSLDITPAKVKAGFSIGLPPVGVGVFSLREVTLAAFLELPFLDGRPTFDFSFSSREKPFNLTVMIFGGGGFFHLQLDTLGIKMLEAALEFGASASIDLGVASGGVYIMAGIYFSIQRKTIDGNEVDAATLAGYLRMGGHLSVLGLITVSLEFYLVFAYEFAKNAAYGRATLTVKVEVLFFSTSVEITVEKRFGGSSGDPYFLEGFDSVEVWDEYAGAFA